MNAAETESVPTTGTMSKLENVLYARKGAIAYVTLNRPKVLNALSRRTWEDLQAAFEDAQHESIERQPPLTPIVSPKKEHA